jgi:ABC-2 type transport system permease protein
VRGLVAIARRELAGLFLGPLAWILLGLALLYNGVFFLFALSRFGGEVNVSLSVLLGGWPFMVLVSLLPPLLTMRMLSEESRSGLLEFLLTAPVSDSAVVLGKTLAALAFLALTWSSVPLYGLLSAALGAAPDWGMLLTAWLGALFASALYCALGLFSSALSSTPLVAAFLAILVNIALFALPYVSESVRFLPRPAVRWAVEKVDVVGHLQRSFLTGALDSAHVVFFVAWTLALLFATVRVVESRRWLG